MTHDELVAFLKNVSVAEQRHGVGRWNDSYLPSLVDAQRRGRPTAKNIAELRGAELEVGGGDVVNAT